MPRGFDEYDGHTVNAESRLRWLVLELMAHTNMDNPMIAGEIKKKTTWDGIWDPAKKTMVDKRKGLSGQEVRAMVNYLRREWGYPIGSGVKGYYWCKSKKELQPTMDHLTDRENAIGKALQGLKVAKFDVDPNTILDTAAPGQQEFLREFTTLGELAAIELSHVPVYQHAPERRIQ